MTRIRLLLLLLLLLFVDTGARAQSSRGLRHPGTSVVESDGSTALSMNPAGLGFLDGFEASFVHTDVDHLSGDGDGLFFASHVLGPLGLGAGFEFLPYPGLNERVFRFSFAAALAMGRTASLGFGVHRFVSDKSPAIDGVVSLDLGFMVRPLDWLALGLSVDDLNTPVFNGGRTRRNYQLGFGFRPGTDRVAIGLEGAVEESSWDYEGRVRLKLEPLSGLQIGVELSAAPRGDHVELAVGAHLALSLGYVHMGAGLFLGGRDEISLDGYTVSAAATTRKRRALYRRSGQVVVLTLGGRLAEQPSYGFFSKRRSTFSELIVALDILRSDPAVDGLLLELRGLQAGWAQVQELRAVLADLRAAGKKVFFHLTMPDTREYYLASESDAVWVQPGGVLLLTGLHVVRTYLKGLLDKLGVSAQFVAIGAYKTAPERFTREGPSGPATEVGDYILDGIYDQVLAGLAASRLGDTTAARHAVDEGPWDATAALRAGLADALAHEEDLQESVNAALDREASLRRDWFEPRAQDTRWGPERHVAVITIDGAMVPGRSRHVPFLDLRVSGGKSVADALHRAADAPDVLGILVRVNSPGGSALAAEQIHRAVAYATERKPLVVSFGDMAASGGYYAACGAEHILAEPATLTGSIGIFAGKFVLTGLFELLGIHRELRKRGERGGFLSLDEAWSEADLAKLRVRLTALYDLFLQRVVEGRDLPLEKVQELAEGRVWLGEDARKADLVDDRGGVREALAWIATKRGDPVGTRYPVRHYPEGGWWTMFGVGAGAQAPGAAEPPDEAGPLSDPPALRFPLPAALRDAAAVIAPALVDPRDGAPLALLPEYIEVR